MQTLDSHGNLTQSQAFDYGNLTTPLRTYNFSYLTASNYTSRYIFNRMTSASVTQSSNTTTLVTNSYDDNPTPSCSGTQGLTASSATGLIDANYGTSFTYRGNVTQTTGVNTTDITCYAYDTTGIMDQTVNATGLSVTSQTQSSTNYSLPGVVTPNGNSNLQTTVSYASSFAVTQVTAGNGASSSTTYDSAGRPLTSTIPDGAQTNYTYVYYSDSGNSSHVNTQTATFINPPSGAPQRWKVTTLDGFGRTIQVDSGYGTVSPGNIVSRVLTQYAPCACSPLLKLSQVSLPFNPNSGSPVWTVYQYDASGRPVQVTAPDGNSNTQYTYNGNSTTIKDPASKKKTQTNDAFGNLIQVTEDPDVLALVTTYTYSPLNQLTQTKMQRGSTTQYRTFSYNGQDMVSANNPENGTVSYTYDASHRVTCRTDAKGQITQYSYNTLGQVTAVSHLGTCGNFVTDSTTGVAYAYDAYGRTSTVTFNAPDLNFARQFTYNYTYSTANRILTQTMGWNMYNTVSTTGAPTTPAVESFGVSYQWDNEGKMTSYNDLAGQQYLYTYDGMGRATNLNPGTCTVFVEGNCAALTNATATYGAANQLTGLSYGAYGTPSMSETRTYNSMLQLISIQGSGINMAYNYPTNNNGRIASSVDAINTQAVNYTYDSLNRLSAAQATNNGWGESYSYDGFGNLSAISPTSQGGETWSATINESNNRLTGVNYDANGNQIGDQVYTNYVWNGENRMVQQLTAGTGGTWYGGTGYSYDPGGRRVMKNVNADPSGTNGGTGYSSGTWEFYFYGLNGRKIGTIDCLYNTGVFGPWSSLAGCWLTGQNTYFAGKMIVEMGTTVMTDRLGSVRSSGAYNSGNIQYFPYGTEQTATAEGWSKFGTYFRDAAGQDYAEQRYYSGTMGRFWSPDSTAGNTANPGSMNKYAYAGGDPMNNWDPSGTNDCPAGQVCVFDDSSSPANIDITQLCLAMLGSQSYQMQFTDPNYAGYYSAQMACENVPNGQIVFGSSSGGGGPISNAVMNQELSAAMQAAMKMLNEPKCAALFSLPTAIGGLPTPDPGVVLQSIYASNSFTYAPIPAQEANTVTSATTVGVGLTTAALGLDGTQVNVNTGVVITLNNTSAGASFVSGNTYNQAITILHELGHAYWDLYGQATSAILPDGKSTPTSIANTKRIEKVCK